MVAEHDPTEFRQQSMELQQSLQQCGHAHVALHDVPDADHFDVIEKMSEMKWVVTSIVLQLAGVTGQ